MPLYTYCCKKCGELTESVHPISVCLTNCDRCNSSDSLIRLQNVPNVTKKDVKKENKKPGEIVKAFIEGAREDLKEQKEEIKKNEYKK